MLHGSLQNLSHEKNKKQNITKSFTILSYIHSIPLVFFFFSSLSRAFWFALKREKESKGLGPFVRIALRTEKLHEGLSPFGQAVLSCARSSSVAFAFFLYRHKQCDSEPCEKRFGLLQHEYLPTAFVSPSSLSSYTDRNKVS